MSSNPHGAMFPGAPNTETFLDNVFLSDEQKAAARATLAAHGADDLAAMLGIEAA